jgi:dTDP-4-dehydrorhamnose reductase
VNGYTNHFWNGITTLEWAKHASYIIDSWHNTPILTQLGTDKNLSKFELLAIIKDIYCKDVQVNPFETEQSINKCLQSDKEITPIELQLKELKAFYRK